MADEFRTIETKTESSSGSTMAFIVGGLVVAVGVIAWLVFGGEVSAPKGASDGASKTSITIDNTAPAPAPAAPAPAAPAPAPAPAAPAPAATAP